MALSLRLRKQPKITITDRELIQDITELAVENSRSPAKLAESCLRLGMYFYRASSQKELLDAIEHLMGEVIDCDDKA